MIALGQNVRQPDGGTFGKRKFAVSPELSVKSAVISILSVKFLHKKQGN